MPLKEAILHAVAMIDKLKSHQVDAALEKIDLDNDAWEEALDALKDEVDWTDEEGEDE